MVSPAQGIRPVAVPHRGMPGVRARAAAVGRQCIETMVSGRCFFITAVLVLTAVQACSTLRVNEDYDPSVNFFLFKTYDWMPGPKKETGDVRADNRLMEQRIKKAIERTLASKGYQKTSLEQPDFFVSYYLSFKTKYESNTVYTTIGFGGFYPYGGLYPFGGVGFHPSFEEYEEGTLLIDISEGKDKNLVWRGSGKRRVDENTSPEKTTALVNQTVLEILDQFPPKNLSGSLQ
jgi:hypothetical protein